MEASIANEPCVPPAYTPLPPSPFPSSPRASSAGAPCRWYHGQITRQVSEDRLMTGKPGSFLFRKSESRVGLSLSIRYGGLASRSIVPYSVQGGWRRAGRQAGRAAIAAGPPRRVTAHSAPSPPVWPRSLSHSPPLHPRPSPLVYLHCLSGCTFSLGS